MWEPEKKLLLDYWSIKDLNFLKLELPSGILDKKEPIKGLAIFAISQVIKGL